METDFYFSTNSEYYYQISCKWCDCVGGDGGYLQ